jgi:hypothetical protein
MRCCRACAARCSCLREHTQQRACRDKRGGGALRALLQPTRASRLLHAAVCTQRCWLQAPAGTAAHLLWRAAVAQHACGLARVIPLRRTGTTGCPAAVLWGTARRAPAAGLVGSLPGSCWLTAAAHGVGRRRSPRLAATALRDVRTLRRRPSVCEREGPTNCCARWWVLQLLPGPASDGRGAVAVMPAAMLDAGGVGGLLLCSAASGEQLDHPPQLSTAVNQNSPLGPSVDVLAPVVIGWACSRGCVVRQRVWGVVVTRTAVRAAPLVVCASCPLLGLLYTPYSSHRINWHPLHTAWKLL